MMTLLCCFHIHRFISSKDILFLDAGIYLTKIETLISMHSTSNDKFEHKRKNQS